MARPKTRLDQALVELGYFESRKKAQAAILAGWVLVDGQPAKKAGQPFAAGSRIELKGRQKFVSRGGEKLEAALDLFHIGVERKICADIGSSTGGFTDCLLQRGAAKVYAIDVGYGQLAHTLRQNPKVAVLEKMNARSLKPEQFAEPLDFVCADVSFISLVKILPAVAAILQPGGEGVLLVKPQFEAEKEEADKGKGVIRDPAIHDRVIRKIRDAASKEGLQPGPHIPSPVLGPAGNREFLLRIGKPI